MTPPAPGDGEPLTHWEGEPVHVWEAVWEVPRVEAWDRLGSTNDRARELAREGALPFTVVVAEEQTAGRGREERSWSSPAGLGLWMSVVLRSRVRDARQLAPLLVGLAVCRAVETILPGVEAGLKWPNDVLLEGRKVCGVLCEAAGDGVVAGIGINVAQSAGDFPEDVRVGAVSLAMAGGGEVSRPLLAGRVLGALRAVLARPTLRLRGSLAEEVARRDVLRGRTVAVSGGPRGVARGVGPEGALLVETGEGEPRRVLAGTVRVVEDGADRG